MLVLSPGGSPSKTRDGLLALCPKHEVRWFRDFFQLMLKCNQGILEAWAFVTAP